MKKPIYISLAALMALAAVSCKKDNVNVCGKMDDPTFKAYCLERFDANGDGKILEDEADEVTEIAVPSMGIKSLKGIEGFKNLLDLDCSDNQITSLDLRENRKLVFLDCRDNFIDVIYLNEGQEIPQFYRTPFLHPRPILLSVNGQQTVIMEKTKPFVFEANFTGEDLPGSITWLSDVPSFTPVTSQVTEPTVTLSYSNAMEIGNMEEGKLYKMWVMPHDGTESHYVRFGIFWTDPLIYFEKPRNPFEAMVDERFVFSIFFYPGQGESGTPSIKTIGGGCNRSFSSGVKEREDEAIHWSEPGEKKVIIYYERNGKKATDTLYVDVKEPLPEIKYL